MATDPNDPRRRAPGPDHPITVTPFAGTVTVRLGDTLVAASHRALVMQEADYPPVYYVPEDDLAEGVAAPSAKTTYCPFKGDAAYFDLRTDAAAAENAVWAYPDAYDDVAAIRGHVAFVPTKVTVDVASM